MINAQFMNPNQSPMPMMNMSGPAAYPQYGMGQPQPALQQFMPFPFRAPPPLTTIYVSDFEESVNGSMLFSHFQGYGKINNFVFPFDHTKKRPKGFAFITYSTTTEADLAKRKANHTKILSSPIRVVSYNPNFKDLPAEANLFFNNLSENITEEDLENWIKEHKTGSVISCKIQYDKGKSKGFGYVQLDSKDNCDRALNATENGKMIIKDQIVIAQRFTPKSERVALKNNLYVKIQNLQSNDISEEQLKEKLIQKFAEYGKISSSLVKKTNDEIPNYFGFICYQDDEEKKISATDSASDALQKLKELEINEFKCHLETVYFENKAERMKKNLLNNLFTKNLRSDVNQNEVFDAYQQFGIISRYIVKTPKAIWKTQYAMIQYTNQEDAKNALANAHKKEEIKCLYEKGNVSLGLWQDKATRSKITEAKLKAKSINSQLFSGKPNEQSNQYQPNFMQNPQANYGQQPQLGAPTVGPNNAMNQLTGGIPIGNPYNNYVGNAQNVTFNSQMMPNQLNFMGNPSYQQQGFNKPKNMNYANKGGPGQARPVRIPQQNRPPQYQNVHNINMNMNMMNNNNNPMNKVKNLYNHMIYMNFIL